MTRPEVSPKAQELAADRFEERLAERIKEKGKHAFVSSHECYGVIAEELDELLGAILEGNLAHVRFELEDIEVAARWASASIAEGALDW